MSQIEFAVNLSRRLESLLEQKHQATGKGLHEKVSSVEGNLPSQLVKDLRYIATMRNSVVHEEGFVINDPARFSATGEAALAQLGGDLTLATKEGAKRSWSYRFGQLQLYMIYAVVLGCASAGAWLTISSFGGIASAVAGLVGGAAFGFFLIGIAKPVIEFIFGLMILGCFLYVIVAAYNWVG